ncbi:MAG: bifunctional DNA-formamidopyrimidine glycosylase/DNA-(apurinic or apyrimidinic site) lyase, partial [Phycisphaerales bacterium]
MPELPEVERVRLTLAPILATRRIHAARLLRADVARGVRRSADLLAGCEGVRATRRGKQLALIAPDGRTLAVHLGMSGQFFWVAPGQRLGRPDHVHAVWTLREGAGAGGRLIFRDPRRFGGLWAYPTQEAHEAARWSRLGPDALAISGQTLRARLGGSRRALKAALLDQAVLAGIGNIYADEALFRARIAPQREAGSITPAEGNRLASAIVRVLRASIEAGGSSLRDYRDGLGDAGAFQRRHAVYGRAGEPCRRCG